WSSGSMEAGSKADGRPPNGDKSSQFQHFGCICGGTVETVPLMGARIMRALDGFGMLGFGIRILGTNAIYAYEASSGVTVDPRLAAEFAGFRGNRDRPEGRTGAHRHSRPAGLGRP